LSSGVRSLDCPDRRGIVSTIAQLLYSHGANILHADQHQDNDAGMFFMRVEWSLNGFDLSEGSFRVQFSEIAREFHMRRRLAWSSHRQRMVLSRAVRWHLSQRIPFYGNKTVVFD
jgi:formyltetrahydrofolate deformylase